MSNLCRWQQAIDPNAYLWLRLFWVCAVTRRRFPVGASPTRQPLQPEATGAVMEVTKWLKTLAFIDALGPPLDHLVDQPELLRSLGGKERVALHSLFHLLDRLAGVFHVNLV